MISKTKNIFLITFGIIILLIVTVIVVLGRFITNNNMNGKGDRFEDIPTTTFDMSKVPTVSNQDTSCKNGTDIISVCMNYDNCCGSNNKNMNVECFCKHPFVEDCNDKYKDCKSRNNQDCSNILNNCCKQYGNIDILVSNFQKPILASQTSNKLCSVYGLLNLEQRCMELCQTNNNCKSYSVLAGVCNLYDKINNTSGDSIYIMKKK
jgi:hypothetical protein